MHILLQNEMESIEAKIKEIESNLQKNNHIISMIKDTVHSLSNGDMQSLDKLQEILNEATGPQPADRENVLVAEKIRNMSTVQHKPVSVPNQMCSLAEQPPAAADIQVCYKVL